MQYVLNVLDRDATTLKIVPLELDLSREHYPPRHRRFATVAYNFGVTATDKAADTIAQVTPCSPEEARAAASALKKEGVAILLYSDITVSGGDRWERGKDCLAYLDVSLSYISLSSDCTGC